MSTSSSRETAPIAPDAIGLDRIDVHSDAALDQWAKRFDVSSDQVKDAVAKVGDLATDVELHLKGSRSTSNEMTTEDAADDLDEAERERKAAERPLKNA
ncbi:DUF3606 domain-containing protein [Variovorax dokdonensis]|uniref:DUF3606 domain-containing protein n=1 Tax=Variovorax dokdonensis TaxID=344883 RepID=A0ABT7N9A0_9BURK|nr:DUF3606 domain-containing protein [Variovorax dokdonensis]MDM0044512.1 DUF3606 domain-containing protein [Variovorax dokdonensis]